MHIAYAPGSLFSRLFIVVTVVGVISYGFFFFQRTRLLPTMGNKMSFKWQFAQSPISEDMELEKRLESINETKIIIMWHSPGWQHGTPKISRQDCGKCDFTFNKTMINDAKTGAVIFYFNGIKPMSMPPKSQRNPNQLHIFWTIEPPPNMRYGNAKGIKSDYEFNASFSYRRTSDFYSPYTRKNPIKRLNLSGSEIISMKKKGGVALISNCGPKHRLKLVKKIQSLGFPLEAFGRCFPESEVFTTGVKDYVQRIRQYRFYFSFENSYHCVDYITEKVFKNALKTSLAIPIVLGAMRESYEFLLPKGSFIFMEDFDTLERLVDYLQYLMKNDTAYLEYFKWHQVTPESEESTSTMAYGFCHVCRALHGINIDDKHNPNYDPLNPPRTTFSDGIVKRNATTVRSIVFEQDTKECNERNASNWKFYRDWKLDDPL